MKPAPIYESGLVQTCDEGKAVSASWSVEESSAKETADQMCRTIDSGCLQDAKSNQNKHSHSEKHRWTT